MFRAFAPIRLFCLLLLAVHLAACTYLRRDSTIDALLAQPPEPPPVAAAESAP